MHYPSLLCIDIEDPAGICCGGGRHFRDILPPNLGDGLGGKSHEGGLIPLAPMRHGGEKGGVGLYNEIIGRKPLYHLAQPLGLVKGDNPWNGYNKAHIQISSGRFLITGKAVDHPSMLPSPLFLENGYGFLCCGAAVDYQGKFQLFSYLYLLAESLLLNCRRGEVAVEIEADFPPGLPLWVVGKLLQVSEIVVSHVGGIVGMNPHNGEDVWICLSDLQRPYTAGGFDANRQEGGYPRLHRPLDHAGEIFLELWQIKMGMAVD